MIPFENLVTALTEWRTKNGLPVGLTDYLGEPTPPMPLDLDLLHDEEVSLAEEEAALDALTDVPMEGGEEEFAAEPADVPIDGPQEFDLTGEHLAESVLEEQAAPDDVTDTEFFGVGEAAEAHEADEATTPQTPFEVTDPDVAADDGATVVAMSVEASEAEFDGQVDYAAEIPVEEGPSDFDQDATHAYSPEEMEAMAEQSAEEADAIELGAAGAAVPGEETAIVEVGDETTVTPALDDDAEEF